VLLIRFKVYNYQTRPLQYIKIGSFAILYSRNEYFYNAAIAPKSPVSSTFEEREGARVLIDKSQYWVYSIAFHASFFFLDLTLIAW